MGRQKCSQRAKFVNVPFVSVSSSTWVSPELSVNLPIPSGILPGVSFSGNDLESFPMEQIVILSESVSFIPSGAYTATWSFMDSVVLPVHFSFYPAMVSVVSSCRTFLAFSVAAGRPFVSFDPVCYVFVVLRLLGHGDIGLTCSIIGLFGLVVYCVMFSFCGSIGCT